MHEEHSRMCVFFKLLSERPFSKDRRQTYVLCSTSFVSAKANDTADDVEWPNDTTDSEEGANYTEDWVGSLSGVDNHSNQQLRLVITIIYLYM